MSILGAKRMQASEITITISAVLSWAILSVASRIILVNFDIDPWMFSFLQLVTGGVALLAVGFKGSGARRSFNRISTVDLWSTSWRDGSKGIERVDLKFRNAQCPCGFSKAAVQTMRSES